MDCCVLPVSILKRRSSGSRLGYRPLSDDVFEDLDNQVTVVVGKEKREFLVDPFFVLDENPFRALIEFVSKESRVIVDIRGDKKVIFVDMDAILFEHMLWLMNNDCSSLFKLNLKELIEFYAQDN